MRTMKAWLLLPWAAAAAGCGGAGTDYNDAQIASVNTIADEQLLAADRRAREDAVANGNMPAEADARYDCADGSGFDVHFDNLAGTATLRGLGGTAITLGQQRAGSGIWYRNADVSLRGKGREATLSRQGEPDTACTARE